MELLEKFEQKPPEIVFEWKDSQTDAEGWLVIDSLKGNAAGGGTRMRKGLTREEVISLAKVMDIKFSTIDFPVGGAKSGINFDPTDPRKIGVLKRWYKTISPMLKNCYGTGGDLNVDEVKEVIPLTECAGVLHPQEGILRGHFKLCSEETQNRLSQLQLGVRKVICESKYSPDVNKRYTIADMITGYGVSESIRHYYATYNNDSIADKRIIIQGWGNVGAAAGYYLSLYGAKIVGIIDKDGGVINKKGFSHNEIKNLFIHNRYADISKADNFLVTELMNSTVWDMDVDVLVPSAASRLITKKHVDRLLKGGLKLISSGANIPFDDQECLFGPTCKYADSKLSVIPDFVSNCGMARTFAYLMNDGVMLDDKSIFKDVSVTIEGLIKGMHFRSKSTKNITRTFLENLIKQTMN